MMSLYFDHPMIDWRGRKEEIFDVTEMKILSSDMMQNKQMKLFQFYYRCASMHIPSE